MKIEVLGTGCAKCNLLEQNARSAADKLGVAYVLEHVRDIREFAKRGVMFTPALAVDGKVVVAGRVPPEGELMRLLGAAASAGH
jgi:small redox-active disulfide protein 2